MAVLAGDLRAVQAKLENIALQCRRDRESLNKLSAERYTAAAREIMAILNLGAAELVFDASSPDVTKARRQESQMEADIIKLLTKVDDCLS